MSNYLKKYIGHVKRQSQSIQEVHAIIFALFFTALVVVLFLGAKKLLYVVIHPLDDVVSVETVQTQLESPFVSMGRLFNETKSRFSSTSGRSMLELFKPNSIDEDGSQLMEITK